ncbi:MAG: HNH endonuclease [Planctomycetes bacterium]|nr:HNH endonuclease [Planctomycetota bacterium]
MEKGLALKARLHESQGGTCYICLKPLDLVGEKSEIDHIVPRARGGKDDDHNFALTHDMCNRQKLDADLRVARCLAVYEDIKKACGETSPNRPNLKDFLERFGGARRRARVRVKDGFVEVFQSQGSDPLRLPVFTDPMSGMRSFSADFTIDRLFHDDRINPRAVGSRVRGLIDEFLGKRPQLHPLLAWIQVSECTSEDVEVKVFDGQHKAVAQLLLGVKTLPVRVFVNPDVQVLLEANTRAGTVLRQVAFDKSVQRSLGSQLYWEKVDDYRKATKRLEGDASFSEQDLVRFFKGEARDIRKYIVDDVRASVMQSPENKLKGYVEFGGKSTEKPLAYINIERTFFALFVFREPLEIPMDRGFDAGENPRQLEKEQLIRLMNLFAEEVLMGKYDPDRGTYRVEEGVRNGDSIPEPHLRAVRLTREEVLYNLLRLVRDCIKRFFLMQQGGVMVEQDELFHRPFPETLWDLLRRLLRSFGALPIWVNKDRTVSSSVFGGKPPYDFWKTIIETGLAPSGMAVLAKPVVLDDLLIGS